MIDPAKATILANNVINKAQEAQQKSQLDRKVSTVTSAENTSEKPLNRSENESNLAKNSVFKKFISGMSAGSEPKTPSRETETSFMENIESVD